MSILFDEHEEGYETGYRDGKHVGFYDGYYQGYGEGAAVAFGIIGMVDAISRNTRIEACPRCLRDRGSRVGWMPPNGPNDWLKTEFGGWLCIACYDEEKAKRKKVTPFRD